MVKYQRGRIQKTFSLSLSLYLTEKKNTSVILVVGGGLVAKSCPTLVTPWTVACQAPLSMGFQARILEWVAISFSRGSC